MYLCEPAVKLLLYGGPATTDKRAAFYHAQCRTLERTIRPSFTRVRESLGPPGRRGQRSLSQLHVLQRAPQRRRMTAMAATVDARKLDLLECAIASLSDMPCSG